MAKLRTPAEKGHVERISKGMEDDGRQKGTSASLPENQLRVLERRRAFKARRRFLRNEALT
jgi:predicted nucleotidyltransferase